jgi:glucosamine kinase
MRVWPERSLVQVQDDVLLLGVDGGGTQCRARLADARGSVLSEGLAGPANIRLGLEQSFSTVREAAGQCLRQAGLSWGDRSIIACLALAGASESDNLAEAHAYPHPFDRAILTNDARAACLGAHLGRDGGIVIVGTGSVGWAIVAGKEIRVGGWGSPISDEGSGAWMGCEAVRRVLWAYDGRIGWTDFLRAIFQRFDGDPHNIVRWMSAARPRDFGSLAPIVVEQAGRGDREARDLMQHAANHIDAIAARLCALGVSRLSLMGGLAKKVEPLLSDRVRRILVAPLGDALSGALHIARRG